jgi:hypothetical protein
MFIPARAALVNDERDTFRRVSKGMAFGPNVADARAGLAHDRDLAAKLPMFEPGLDSTALREEPHLVL